MKASEIFETPEASGFDRVTPDTEVKEITKHQSELDQPASPVYTFFTAPEEVQRPVVEEAIKKASKEQGDITNKYNLK